MPHEGVPGDEREGSVQRGARPVDPLYPEPGGDTRWVAERGLGWPGPGQRRAPRRSLRQLIAGEFLTVDAAALLAVLAGHRASVLVIAADARAGKTTLLEALLPWYPAGDRRIRLRGSFETFGWERDPRFVPSRSVLIAEEISGHLPTYLWGPGVGRFLGWSAEGSALLSTAHGDSTEDVAQLLTGYPLRLPLTSLLAFDAIVRLGPLPLTSGPDRARVAVRTVWSATRTSGGGIVPVTLLDDGGIAAGAVGDLLARLGADGIRLGEELVTLRERIERGSRLET